MNRKKLLALLLYNRRLKKQKKNRIWVHPLNEKRRKKGIYRLLNELKKDEKKFFNYFRMSMKYFFELHEKIKNKIQRQNTLFRNCIQPIEMLAITLR